MQHNINNIINTIKKKEKIKLKKLKNVPLFRVCSRFHHPFWLLWFG
jgi:hypothetical protein